MALALALPLLYSILYAPLGFEDTDTGFIIAFGHRVAAGEIPYRDFYYIRPPLSALFSGLLVKLIPYEAQVLHIRQLFYFYVSIIVLLTISAVRLTGVALNKKETASVFVVSYVISVHNFPPMIWHTIDGLFWSAIALFFIAKTVSAKEHGSLYLFLAGIASAFAALTKQSYYFLPLLLVLAITIHNRSFLAYERKLKLHPFLIGVAAPALLFLYWLNQNNLIGDFLFQTKGAGLIDFIKAGFLAYPYSIFTSWPTLIAFALSIFYGLYLYKFGKKNLFADALNGIVIIWCAVYIALNIYKTVNASEALNPIFSLRFDTALFISTFAWSAYNLIKLHNCNHIDENAQLNFHKISALGLLISWMSSISWGYMTPALYFTPISLIAAQALKQNSIIISRIGRASVLILLICISISNLKPYRDESVGHLSKDLGEISERVSGIYSTSQTFDKYKELKELLLKLGCDKTAVLPSQPLAHYLFGCKNPLRADWEMDAENAYSFDSEFNKLKQDADFALVLNEKTFAFEGSQKYQSTLTHMVEKQLPILAKTRYYTIYKTR